MKMEIWLWVLVFRAADGMAVVLWKRVALRTSVNEDGAKREYALCWGRDGIKAWCDGGRKGCVGDSRWCCRCRRGSTQLLFICDGMIRYLDSVLLVYFIIVGFVMDFWWFELLNVVNGYEDYMHNDEDEKKN